MKLGPILTLVFSAAGAVLGFFANRTASAQDARFQGVEDRLGRIENVLMGAKR